jgi:hypothetical protein
MVLAGGRRRARSKPAETPENEETTVSQTSLQQHSADADVAVPSSASHAVVRYNPDAPSEEWGWHGSWRVFAPRGSTILLSLGVIVLFLQNFTVHESHVENFYFNGIALIGALWIVHRVRSGRKLRRTAEAPRHAAD